MKKKVSALLIISMILSCFIIGPQTVFAKEDAKPKVAVLWCSLAAPACQAGAVASEKEAEAQDVELIEMDAEMDAQKQSDQIANAITQGCNVIILNPVDAKSLIPACQKVKDAGILLIVIGMQLDESASDLVDCFVGGDDLEVGVRCGEMMKEALPDGGKIAIVEGAAGSDPQIKRTQGFEDEVKDSKIEVVDKQNSNWSTEEAMAITEDFLIKYPELSGIFVHDDSMAAGVIEAVKAAGKSERLRLSAIMGIKLAVKQSAMVKLPVQLSKILIFLDHNQLRRQLPGLREKKLKNNIWMQSFLLLKIM